MDSFSATALDRVLAATNEANVLIARISAIQKAVETAAATAGASATSLADAADEASASATSALASQDAAQVGAASASINAKTAADAATVASASARSIMASAKAATDALASLLAQVSALVGGADADHNTLGKIAALLTTHANNTANPHVVTATQVGLGNVANLAPADLPVSTAAQAAIASAVTAGLATLTAGSPDALNSFVEAYNRFLVDESAAAAMNTAIGVLQTAVAARLVAASNLSDLTNPALARGNLGAAATSLNLSDLADKAAARTNLLAAAAADLATHVANVSNPHAVTAAQVGLGNVANLAPAALPVSTAAQAALDARLVAANNLSDLPNTITARANLGAASAIILTTGTIVVGNVQDTLANHFEGRAASGHNLLINGSFTINQRSYVSGAALAASAFGHDRWKAGSGGGAYTFVQGLIDTVVTVTSGTIFQPIAPSAIVTGQGWLIWQGSAKVRVWQGAPSSAPFAAGTPITICGLPYNSLFVSGLSVSLQANVEFSTGTLCLAQLELVTSSAGPAKYERRHYAEELFLCQRYYEVCNFIYSGNISIGQQYYQQVVVKVKKYTTPTAVITTNTANSFGTITQNNAGADFFFVQATASATGFGLYSGTVALSAEL